MTCHSFVKARSTYHKRSTKKSQEDVGAEVLVENVVEEVREDVAEIVRVPSRSAASSLINPARSSELIEGEATSALFTRNETQEDSIGGISVTSSRLTISDLSSSGTTVSQELRNELKMEIENMKSQLPIYSETFICLQMGPKLGGGTFGTVYEAHARSQKIAVKLLALRESETLPASVDYMSLNEFYAEALLLSNLSHPNVLHFEFIISDVSPYNVPGMAMEIMSDNLHHFIRNAIGFLGWNNIWTIAVQVARGLKYLHSQNIVHFDIKSSNILLSASDSPVANSLICKVADFGIAMRKSSDAPIPIYSQRGSTHYMAPEVIRTGLHGMQLVTEKVDVYSFGILLWELIMRELPYNGKADDEIENLVSSGTRPSLPDWLDVGWKGLMESCWREDEDGRPDFDQILDRLGAL